MWKAGQTNHTLFLRAEVDGYPCFTFETWYQQGKRSYLAGFPRRYIKQAFRALCQQWLMAGKTVEMWHIRAFVYGSLGGSNTEPQWVRPGYSWPEPVDPSWSLFVCYYPDGFCDLDMAHKVSRRFWSEGNGFVELPEKNTARFTKQWYEQMGFTVMVMTPFAELEVAAPERHLKVVR